LIPDTWSVELVSGFLVNALRRIVRERSETMIAKALSGAENLKTNADLIGKIEDIGPTIEA
jgi:vacuolar protein sorting-associated protein 3